MEANVLTIANYCVVLNTIFTDQMIVNFTTIAPIQGNINNE